jgi:putative glutamine amidotransferase
MTSRPRIGITLGTDEAGRRYQLKRAYADAVLAAGGLPVLVPWGDGPVAALYLEQCDGLVLSGGHFDIPPERYGETRRASCGRTQEARTDFEWGLCQAAMAAGIPLLGVCGGMQLMNVVRGGTLWQDLTVDLGLQHEQPEPKDLPSHPVEIVPETLLARLVGTAPLPANTTHHQAVKAPGAGLLVSGRTADGVVEALELPDAPFALGVQWHPESVVRHEPRHAAIYLGLVKAALDRRR